MGNITILIVEDEPIIGADLADRLTDMGYRTFGPYDKGEDAFDAFSQVAPDLILMDIHLAGKWNGIETAQKMLEQRQLPIIYLTSNSDDVTFAQAKKTNPAAFLSKPFRGRDLKHTIELSIVQTESNGQTTEKQIENGQPVLLEDRLFIKTKDRLERLYIKDILWIEADDYYCRVFTQQSHILLSQTLAKFSEKIGNQPDLFRVHRSFIVNLKHIEQISESYVTIGNKKIPISRNTRAELLQRLKTV